MLLFKTPETDSEFILREKNSRIKYDVRKEQEAEILYVSDSYEKNLAYIEKKFSYPDIEVDVKYGGQSLYYYIFSIE